MKYPILHKLSKVLILSLILCGLAIPLVAAFIQPTDAVKAAQTWLKSGPAELSNPSPVSEVLVYRQGGFLPALSRYNEKGSELPLIYQVNFSDGSFAIVSADDNSVPVLAYSAEPCPLAQSYPPAFWEWLGLYELQIAEIIQSETVLEQHQQQWSALLKGKAPADYKQNRGVAPLIATNWNQDWPYNELCPVDAQGPGGHVYAGCVATAMGMVMKYWNHPTTGVGSNTYYAPGYGYQSANFGATTYLWDEMPNSVGSSNLPVATLLYHCGVAVNMNYSPNGSGASSSDAADALAYHFRYPTAAIHNRSSYSLTNWNNLLTDQINNGSPMYYSGSGSGGGHAFVLDGYDTAGYFHFNFGWSGSGNGYYYVTNINPGGSSFNQYQSAIINSIPENYSFANVRVRMQAITATVGQNFPLTITTNPLLGSWNVNHFEFLLHYDQDFMMYTGASIENTIAAGGTLTVNQTEPGVLFVSWDGDTSLIGGGKLISFNFTPLDAGEFLFDISGMKYNNSPVYNTQYLMVTAQAPVATLAQSQISLTNVMHLGYQQIGTTEIRTTYLLPSWNVNHYQFDLFYDPTKLEYVGVESVGTLSGDWDAQAVLNNPGSVSISCDFTEPLTGDGTLIKARFRAIGNAGSLVVTQVAVGNFFYNDTAIAGTGSANFILSIYTSNQDDLVQAVPTLQIHPNPITSSASIKFSGLLEQEASLKVYNLKGQLVKTFTVGKSQKEINWDAKDDQGRPLATGVYLIRWQQGNQQGQSKVMILR